MKRQQGKEPFWKQIVRYRQQYIMLIPFFLIFIVFTVWPVIMSVILSFTNYNVFETPKFVGWDNYVNLLVNDDVFVTAFRNTIVFAIFTGPVSFFVSMFLAWIINELPKGIQIGRASGRERV